MNLITLANPVPYYRTYMQFESIKCELRKKKNILQLDLLGGRALHMLAWEGTGI